MDRVGLIVAVVVLLSGCAAGLWRRRSDGRLRDVGGGGGTTVVADRMEEPGVIEDVERERAAAGDVVAPELLESLGVQPAQATLLQFSSAFCTPCRSVRRVSSEVADLLPGVRHVEVDAESHLDAVRELDIWRTPTLLVLNADGRVVKRATGVPSKPQLIAVLGEILLPSR